jgi:hypothetical protein
MGFKVAHCHGFDPVARSRPRASWYANASEQVLRKPIAGSVTTAIERFEIGNVVITL